MRGFGKIVGGSLKSLAGIVVLALPVGVAAQSAPPFITSPGWTFEGDQTSAWLGFSVAGAGDVNGDGFRDIIVGAPGKTGTGAAYIFYGSPAGLSATAADWWAVGQIQGEMFGYAVAAAGDVNGDGFDDIVVGAPMDNRIDVFFGSATGPPSLPDWSAQTNSFSELGASLASNVDINGDGYTDIVAGAPTLFTDFNFQPGGLFVWAGGAAGLGAPGTELNAAATRHGAYDGALFGFMVRNAGRLSAANNQYLLVGAPGGSQATAYILNGSSGPTSGDPLWPPQSLLDFHYKLANYGSGGLGLAGAGNLNGDCCDDVIVGEPVLFPSWQGPPRASIHFGPNVRGAPDQILTAPAPDALDEFGQQVAPAGDVNGDGQPDLVIADWTDLMIQGSGLFHPDERVFVFLGNGAGVEPQPAWMSQILPQEPQAFNFGSWPTTIGPVEDLNGDGFADLLVGLPYYNGPVHSTEGRVLVWYGGAQTLDVARAGNGAGYVISSPPGITCGTDCTEVYDQGSVVNLSVGLSAGSQFAGWSGACTGSGLCSVVMTSARTVTATINLMTYDLVVTRDGTGQGTVTSIPAGIDCGLDCQQAYDYGTAVSLSAAPAPGSVFTGWSGDPDCADGVVSMTSARNCTATFDIRLAVSKSGLGTGTVTSSPPGIACGPVCQAAYASGTVVTLSAMPDPDAVFAGWSGDSDCTDGLLTMTASKACVAVFNRPGDWAMSYSRNATTSEDPVAMVTDLGGQVYVVGNSCTVFDSVAGCTQSDLVTLKYSPSGAQMWAAIYDGPAGGNDFAKDVALNAQGDVYVAASGTWTSGTDYLLLKYNSTGTLLWANHYNGPGNGFDQVEALVLDSQGRPVVTGATIGSSGARELTTVMWDGNGQLLWARTFTDPASVFQEGRGVDLQVDAAGAIYVTGWAGTLNSIDLFFGGDLTDYVTLKYDAAGALLWQARYNSSPGPTPDRPAAMVLDGNGHVIVTGQNSTSSGGTTIAYDAGGTQLWTVEDPGTAGLNLDLDAAGNIYMLGQWGGSYTSRKYSPSGSLLQSFTYQGPVPGSEVPRDQAVSPDDHLYITGRSSSSSPDAATVMFDPNGVVGWEGRYNGVLDSVDEARAMAISAEGNVHVAVASCAELDGSGACLRNQIVTLRYFRCPDNDGDRICDFTDPDDDNDGIPDNLDCAPFNPAVSTVPAPVGASLQFMDASSAFQWGIAAGANAYDVYHGTRMSTAPWTWNQTCLKSADAVPQYGEPVLPASAGELFFYLVSGVNICGEGSAGQTSGGASRGTGTACPAGVEDMDLDGWLNQEDNCAAISNPDQADADADGVGDLCDNCPMVKNPTQSDANGNGIGDACDV